MSLGSVVHNMSKFAQVVLLVQTHTLKSVCTVVYQPPTLQQEEAKSQLPAKPTAPSDAEVRAQAAESRLSRQVRQARQAQQVPATGAQHAQQAADVAPHQAPAQVRRADWSSGRSLVRHRDRNNNNNK